ncbi:MAG: 2-oxoacid:acceptor oxidoreductase family protein [Trebonia sp.]
MFQVRFHGRGGQGVVTAAELLASAAFREDRYAQAFPSFGSERMGAPVMSFCRIDDKPIRTREPVTEPDALLIQDPTLLHQAGLLDGLRPDGYVLVNSSRGVADIGLAEFAAQRHSGHLLTVSATSLALANLDRPLPGAPMLGGFAALTRTEQTVSLDALLAAITERFGDRPRVAAGNSAAARAAFDFVTGELDELKAVTHHA